METFLKKHMFFVLFYVLCNGNYISCADANEFRSDYTYYPLAGGWFKVHPAPVDWHTARVICHYEGAEMAAPFTKEIYTVIKELVSKSEPKLRAYHAGVHATFGDGVMTSINGVPLEKFQKSFNWDIDEPNNNQKNQNCLVYSNDGVWDLNCEDYLPFICFRQVSVNDELTECGTVDKAYKYDIRSKHCYKYHKQADVWPRAQKICMSEGGHLAIVNNELEAEVLNDLIFKSPRPLYTTFDSVVAIGFLEWGHFGTWWTVHGQTLEEAGFEEWANGQPDNMPHPDKTRARERQSCGGFRNGKLDDIWCDVPFAYICEKTLDSLRVNATIIY